MNYRDSEPDPNRKRGKPLSGAENSDGARNGDPDPEPPVELTIELIRKAKIGDRDALGELMVKLGPWIEALVHREWYRTRGSYTAEDIESTVLCQVVRKFEKFDGHDRRQLQSWIGQLCKHKVLDILRLLRSKKRDEQREERLRTSMDLVWRGDSPQTANVKADEAGDLRAALDRLDDSDRRILDDHDLRRISMRDVAVGLGISEDTAKKRLQRARLKLRKAMDDLGQERDRRADS